MVGGLRVSQKICRGSPFSISSVKEQLLRPRCDPPGCEQLTIEIIAEQKVTPALEPPNRAKTGRETGPPGRTCRGLFGNLVVQI
jgi:hypothetical protein